MDKNRPEYCLLSLQRIITDTIYSSYASHHASKKKFHDTIKIEIAGKKQQFGEGMEALIKDVKENFPACKTQHEFLERYRTKALSYDWDSFKDMYVLFRRSSHVNNLLYKKLVS